MDQNEPPDTQAASTASSSRTDGKCYCFVTAGYKAEDNIRDSDFKLIHQATDKCVKKGYMVKTIGVRKAMELSKKVSGVSLVLPSFEGAMFEHLKQLKFRIYSPLAVIQCLDRFGEIRDFKYPVYSLAMHGTVLTITGISLEMKYKYSTIARYCGGECLPDLTSDTTHLIATFCDATASKYNAACDRKVPVVLPEWIDRAWAASLDHDLVYVAADDIADFIVPIFKNFVMSCSGFGEDERNMMASVITHFGGTYTGSLNLGNTTHLIIDTTSGQKFNAAKSWGIHVVMLKWLIKCALKERLFPESDYNPENQYAPRKNTTDCLSNETICSLNTAHQRIFNPISKETAPDAQKSDSNLSVSTFGSKKSGLRRKDAQMNAKHLDPIEKVNFDDMQSNFGTFLENCRIMFFEVQRSNILKLYRKLANLGGCTIVESIEEKPTHVVVPPATYPPESIAKLKSAHDSDIFVVKTEWLIDCTIKTDCIAVDDYIYAVAGIVQTPAPNVNTSSKPGAFKLAEIVPIVPAVVAPLEPEDVPGELEIVQKETKTVTVAEIDGFEVVVQHEDDPMVPTQFESQIDVQNEAVAMEIDEPKASSATEIAVQNDAVDVAIDPAFDDLDFVQNEDMFPVSTEHKAFVPIEPEALIYEDDEYDAAYMLAILNLAARNSCENPEEYDRLMAMPDKVMPVEEPPLLAGISINDVTFGDPVGRTEDLVGCIRRVSTPSKKVGFPANNIEEIRIVLAQSDVAQPDVRMEKSFESGVSEEDEGFDAVDQMVGETEVVRRAESLGSRGRQTPNNVEDDQPDAVSPPATPNPKDLRYIRAQLRKSNVSRDSLLDPLLLDLGDDDVDDSDVQRQDACDTTWPDDRGVQTERTERLVGGLKNVQTGVRKEHSFISRLRQPVEQDVLKTRTSFNDQSTGSCHDRGQSTSSEAGTEEIEETKFRPRGDDAGNVSVSKDPAEMVSLDDTTNSINAREDDESYGKRQASSSELEPKRKRGRRSRIELLEEAEKAPFFPKRIATTGFSKDENANMKKSVARLGSQIVDTDFDLLIVKKITRNQKVLSAVAGGIRLVPVEYLVESARQSSWLNANLYELGNVFLCPKKFKDELLTEDSFEDLAIAAYKWRLRIEQTGERPFNGWTVILFLNPVTVKQYVPIIEAGGGRAMCYADQPSNFRGITHAILALKQTMQFVNTETLKKMGKANIPFYSEHVTVNQLLSHNNRSVKLEFHELHKEYHFKTPKKR